MGFAERRSVHSAVLLGAHGAVMPADAATSAASYCSAVQKAGAGLELSLPLIHSSALETCSVTDTAKGQALTSCGWMLQLLAWAFATLFVAGFTTAVRK